MRIYVPSSWGPGHLELAEKARKLGWHGGRFLLGPMPVCRC